MCTFALQVRALTARLLSQIFLYRLPWFFSRASFFPLHAQVNELNTQGTALQNAVATVQSGSKTYEQKVSFEEPAVIRYSYDEIDQKGNRVNYVYEFNLADLDPYAVREQTQKDLI